MLDITTNRCYSIVVIKKITTNFSEETTMNKNTYQKILLEKGEMHVYDFGEIKMHAYKTNDFLSDEVFVFEKSNKAVVLEPPCFFDNCRELAAYLSGYEVVGVLIAYHGAGASFLPEAPKYATKNAIEYAEQGGGKALIENFTSVFGQAFDSAVHKIDRAIGEGELQLGGIKFVIKQTREAYDVEIPQLNAVYTHMLGHDCHSIVANADHAQAMINELNGYLQRGIGLILTSHYTPEDLKDAQTKIEYLQEIKKTALECSSAQAFIDRVKARFPEYGGGNYLEMTAHMFFK